MPLATEAAKHLEILKKIGAEITVPKGGSFDYKNVYYLIEGTAALTHLTENGDQSSFLYFRPGMLLNFLRPVISHIGIGSEMAIKRFAKLNHVIYAKTDCRCLCINGDVMLDYLSRNPEHYTLLLQSLAENLINLLALSTDIVTKPACVRVCQLLQNFMTDDTPPQIPRYLTYTEIAFFLHLHVITVTKIFKALKAAGIISKKGWTTVVTDVEGLRGIVEGTEEFSY